MQKILKANDVGLDLLENCKATVQAKFSRLRYLVVLSVFPQDEEPWLAGLLVIRVIFFRATPNGGHTDAVGISEVKFAGRHGLAILHLHQRHPVLAPDFLKGISFGKPGTQSIAVALHRFRADGVQRQQDVIFPFSKTANPVLGRTCSGISDQLRSLRGSFDERTK